MKENENCKDIVFEWTIFDCKINCNKDEEIFKQN